MNILVLCTGNSARSILLECLLNRDDRITAYSAGSKPAGKVHPQSLTLLADKGYDTAGLRSKSWDEFAQDDAPQMDAVITVCGSAAGETCPMWPGTPVRVHWGIDDPAAASPEDWDSAFELAYSLLLTKADALSTTEFADLSDQVLVNHLKSVGAPA
ncbi:arsenate reductase ArsC [Thalassobium sp. R2A62]|uniref:arsenate reductase ArsC n=1 Tax=Thalassobium sp. R2A62 TaxID=633131 RepID=UPI0001B1D43A|nr:arsenate reductase ArsC [Thalassobium sp. R2A62]EET49039.1 arsenate reductase [Thalassobium sp. R2A62]